MTLSSAGSFHSQRQNRSSKVEIPFRALKNSRSLANKVSGFIAGTMVSPGLISGLRLWTRSVYRQTVWIAWLRMKTFTPLATSLQSREPPDPQNLLKMNPNRAIVAHRPRPFSISYSIANEFVLFLCHRIERPWDHACGGAALSSQYIRPWYKDLGPLDFKACIRLNA